MYPRFQARRSRRVVRRRARRARFVARRPIRRAKFKKFIRGTGRAINFGAQALSSIVMHTGNLQGMFGGMPPSILRHPAVAAAHNTVNKLNYHAQRIQPTYNKVSNVTSRFLR